MVLDAPVAAAAAAGGAEVRWAKGVQPGCKPGTWAMAFQIRGKRHSLTLRGVSQAEAAVGYDLAGYWSHGNNPAACTRYNFALFWYPQQLLEEVKCLPSWDALKLSLEALAASGGLRRLVPFDGAGRRYEVTDAQASRPHSALHLLINARGLHLHRGSWTCVPMEDLQSFGCVGGLLRLTYALRSGRAGRLGATTATFRCQLAAQAYQELQTAVAACQAAHLPTPRDLGADVPLLAHGSGGRCAARAQAPRKLAGWGTPGEAGSGYESGWEEEQEAEPAGELAQPDGCDPSLEELELLTQFADLASRSGCASAHYPSASPSRTSDGGAAAAMASSPAPEEPAAALSGSASGSGSVPAAALAGQAGLEAAEVKAGGAEAQLKAEPSNQTAGTDSAAGLPPRSPSGSSTSSRAGGKPAAAAVAAGGPPSSGSGMKRQLAEQEKPEGPLGQLASDKRAQDAPKQAGAKRQRRERSQGSPAPHPGAHPSRQQHVLAAHQQRQMQVLQMLQLGMTQLVPLAAMPPHMVAAYRKQQAAAAAGSPTGAAAAMPAGAMGALPCLPFQHPGVVMVPMMAPAMMTPSMAAAMQAQAARHMQAAAAAAAAARAGPSPAAAARAPVVQAPGAHAVAHR